MSEKYLNVSNLPWDRSITDNTVDYRTVQNANDGIDAMIYRFVPEEQQQGKGILELQMIMANIFRHLNFESLYKPFYIENEEYRKALTSGVYGPKTMELMMEYQKRYMVGVFDGKWDPAKGFGSFGTETKKAMRQSMKKVRRIVSDQVRAQRLKDTEDLRKKREEQKAKGQIL